MDGSFIFFIGFLSCFSFRSRYVFFCYKLSFAEEDETSFPNLLLLLLIIFLKNIITI